MKHGGREITEDKPNRQATAVMAQQPTTAPPPLPLKPAAFPPFREAVLPNGLRLVVVENHRLPIVSLSLAFEAGKIVDPAGKEGLAAMAAGLLTKGAGTRTADQVSNAIERVGGSIGAGTGSDFLTVSAGVLSKDAALAFDLAGDAVARPRFDSTEISLLRTQTLSGLDLERSQPASVAERVMDQMLFGDHPYAKHPTPGSVKAIGRSDLVAFQKTRLRPAGALLVVAGDITLAEARRHAARAFKGWVGSPASLPAARPFPARTKTEIYLVHRPGSVQSNILAANLTYRPATGPTLLLRNGRCEDSGSSSRSVSRFCGSRSWLGPRPGPVTWPSTTGSRSLGRKAATCGLRQGYRQSSRPATGSRCGGTGSWVSSCPCP